MALDFGPYDDILSWPDGGNARAGAKFRPKAKLQSKKVPRALLPNNLTIAVEDCPLVTTAVDEDCRKSHTKIQIPEIMSCTTTVDDPLANLPGSDEIISDIEALDPGFLLTNGDKSSAPVDTSSQHPVDTEYMDSRGALQLESIVLKCSWRLAIRFCEIRKRDC